MADDALAIIHVVHAVLYVAHVLSVTLILFRPNRQSVERGAGTLVVVEHSRVLVPLEQVISPVLPPASLYHEPAYVALPL